MENKEIILEENGFSKSESKVYITLLKLGETKAGQIIKQTSLQSSVVHNALNTLTNKGFINHILKGKIKHYHALEPKIIKKYIKSKQESLEKILPELELLRKKNTVGQVKVEIYEGYNGLFNATLKILENSKKNETYKYFASVELNKDAIDFFKKVDNIKKERNLIIKGIANLNSKNILKNYKNSKLKYTNQTIPAAMNIFQDSIIIFTLSDKPTAILIKSEEIAKQYHKMWDEIYNSIK